MGIEIATSEEIADLKRLVVGLSGQVQGLTRAFEAQALFQDQEESSL